MRRILLPLAAVALVLASLGAANTARVRIPSVWGLVRTWPAPAASPPDAPRPVAMPAVGDVH
ncbi:MAG: hypothetical protein Q8P18_25495 [Pseudomonadota bacterium]|nr:hypothetical protein [Pseudomonadota bacterium]